MIVYLTQSKCETLKRLCSDLLETEYPTIRFVSKVLGKMVSSFPGVQFGPIYYRILDNEKTKALQQNYVMKYLLQEKCV